MSNTYQYNCKLLYDMVNTNEIKTFYNNEEKNGVKVDF